MRPSSRAVLIVAALTLALGAGPASAAEGEENGARCDVGKPPEWTIIPSASGFAGSGVEVHNLLCNYTVLRTITPADGGAPIEAPSGVAITIEFYCRPEDGEEAFTGKTGERDTETERSEDHVIIEEGPAAANPDNPQDSGVFSSFQPGVFFNLFEKEWLKMNSQTIATLVVLTTERDVVTEDMRFGVDDVEGPARLLANAHAPKTSSCDVPDVEIPAGGSATGTPGTGGKGSKGTNPLVVILGGGAVVIGGRIVWRRRKGSRRARPASAVTADVPAPCQQFARDYTRVRNEAITLLEAGHDLGEQLRRAEAIHANNIMKANMVVGFEVGQVVGNTVGDLAQLTRVRPSSGGRGQLDTWKPPSRISARMRQMLEKAETALSRARNQAKAIGEQLAQISDVIRSRTARAVDTALANVETFTTRLRNLEERLPAAKRAREAFKAAEEAYHTKAGPAGLAATRAMEDVGRVRTLRDQANAAFADTMQRVKSRLGHDEALAAITEATKEVDEIAREITALEKRTGPNVAELLTEQRQRLARYQRLVTERRDAFTTIERQLDAEVKPILERAKRLSNEFDIAEKTHRDLAAASEKLYDDVESARRTASAFNDVTDNSVAATRRDLASARQAVSDASSHVDPDLAAQRAAKQAQLDTANNDLAFAESFLDGVRDQINREAAFGGKDDDRPGILGLVGQFIFGVGQSPEEIMTILREGQENIRLLKSRLAAVERAGKERRDAASALHGQLQHCIQQHRPVASGQPVAAGVEPPP